MEGGFYSEETEITESEEDAKLAGRDAGAPRSEASR